ncbi:hypothetical protein [Bosea sp. (in: a-proteobacteria)]|uniref:hypothetical protein n=1 Tax=Bosea sp. (in: a-proteobacteria) TaxID=1871050 RepID=UPI001AC7DBC2|nr:hypothetical protein [Bosea sp. (in: a-proteobacteria)]MBN9435564.1 hypothetical protein [Bosea sp. (in: a-proteobacteria)]
MFDEFRTISKGGIIRAAPKRENNNGRPSNLDIGTYNAIFEKRNQNILKILYQPKYLKFCEISQDIGQLCVSRMGRIREQYARGSRKRRDKE